MIRSTFAVLLGLAVLVSPAPLAVAQDEEVQDVSKKEAKAALDRFKREFDTEDIDLRLDSMSRLRKVIHPEVADKFLDLALRHPDFAVRGKAFSALSKQVTSKKKIGPSVARYLHDQAKAAKKRKAKGDYGVILDKKTGEPITDTPEAKEKLREKRERGKMLAAAVKCIYKLDYRDKKAVESLEEFLSDGDDTLVAYVLELFGKWEEWSVMKKVLELFEIYPHEDRFETGTVKVDTGAAGTADARAAKAKWMAKYGDPDKRRPRPIVTRAIKKLLKTMSGEDIGKPQEMREWMRTPAVKRKVKKK